MCEPHIYPSKGAAENLTCRERKYGGEKKKKTFGDLSMDPNQEAAAGNSTCGEPSMDPRYQKIPLEESVLVNKVKWETVTLTCGDISSNLIMVCS